MSIVDNFPDIKPSLNLDFANTKSLDPRIDFDRSSTATYYDGQTFAKAEENLFKYSEEFDQWNTVHLDTFGDVTSAPDGTTTADRLQANATNNRHYAYNASSTLEIFTEGGRDYALSVYLKKDTNDFAQIWGRGLNFGSSNVINIDLSTGTITNVITWSASLSDVGNGWYRLEATVTAFGTDGGYLTFGPIPTATHGRNTAYSANGTESIFIWGAQLEERSQVTAYTPTTDQPITNYIPVLQTASSDEPRFDHDPLTGESKGLLIEEQRTNLVPRSYASSGPYIESPAGDNLARVLTESNSTTLHRVGSPTFSVSVGEPIAVSAFIKNVHGDRNVLLNTNATTGSRLNFNPRTGTVNSSSGASSISIQDVGQGWWRVSYIGTGRNNNNRVYVQLNKNTTAGDQTYLGDGFSSIAFYGLQVEEGSFPTSYIKTEGSQVTRVADSASISGSNFSEWYRQDEGTFVTDFDSRGNDDFNVLGSIGTVGTVGNRILLEHFRVYFTNGSVTYSISSSGVNTSAGENSVSFSVDSDGISVSTNGQSAAESSSTVSQGSVESLLLGRNSNTGARVLNGTIKRLTYYPKRLPNTVLQALTKD